MHADSTTSGKARILRGIGRIASPEFQEMACLNATPEEYVLLEELIETTISRAELEVTNETLAAKWSAEEKDALRTFADHVNRLFDKIGWQDKQISLSFIVKEDSSMRSIRDAANDCLKRIGASFSLDELLAD